MTGKNKGKGEKEDSGATSEITIAIEQRPGIHFNSLARHLHMAHGELQYHLRKLEETGEIVVDRGKYFTRYFLSGWDDPKKRELLTLIRLKIPRRILLFLIEHPNTPAHVLVKEFHLTKSTLSYHMQRLVSTGTVMERKKGREKIYKVKDKDENVKIIESYHHTLGDEVVDRFVELWLRL